MGRYLTIEELHTGIAAYVYALRFDGSDGHLMNEFFLREEKHVCSTDEMLRCADFNFNCSQKCTRTQYLIDMFNYIRTVAPKRGFIEHQQKGGLAKCRFYENDIGAISSGPFRIYGIFMGPPGNKLFIAGDGGLKQTRTYQEDPWLNQQHEIVSSARAAILNAFKSGDIGIERSRNGRSRLSQSATKMKIQI